MAQISLLILFVIFQSQALAQLSQVRPSGIKADIAVDQNVLQLMQDAGWGGHHAVVSGMQRNLSRYIKSCLLNPVCELTQQERTLLEEILEVANQKQQLIYFASNSQDLFDQVSTTQKQKLLDLGYAPDQELFNLASHKTHRLVVTRTQPSPIIFNQDFFQSSADSPSPFELISYLVHEVGHHTGLGFEAEAQLDRLAEKLKRHLEERGDHFVSRLAPGLQIYTTNFVSSHEYFDIGPAKVDTNNIGEIVLYDDQHILRLSELTIAATFNPTILEEGVQQFIYYGVGAPRFAGLRRYKEGHAQVIQGPFSLIALNSAGSGGIPLKAQYEILIPMEKFEGHWRYNGQPIVGSLNNVKNFDETLVEPNFNYKIFNLEKTQQPAPGILVEMTCPPQNSELRLLGQMLRQFDQKMTDYDNATNFQMNFLRQEGRHCFYHVNQGSTDETVPEVRFQVGEVLIFPPMKDVIRVSPDRNFVMPFGSPQVPFPDSASVYRNLLISWAYYDSDKQTWVAFEKIEGDRNLKQEYLDDPSLQIVVEADLSFAEHAYCGGMFSIKGRSQIHPQAQSNVYLSDHFYLPYDSDLNGRIFSYLNFQKSGTDVSMIGLVNMPWVRAHLTNARIDSFSMISCTTGFLYFPGL